MFDIEKQKKFKNPSQLFKNWNKITYIDIYIVPDL